MVKWGQKIKKEGWLFLLLAVSVCWCLWGHGYSPPAALESADEQRLSSILSAMEGAGQVQTAVFYEDEQPIGAVIVADGADDLSVQLHLTRAVMTLLRLDADQIVICKSKEGQP